MIQHYKNSQVPSVKDLKRVSNTAQLPPKPDQLVIKEAGRLAIAKQALPKKKRNPNRGGWEYPFLKNPPGFFRSVTLALGIPEKILFGNPKVRNQDPQNFHMS